MPRHFVRICGGGRVSFFFFFQAEDGIRDLTVTGVQTCALPICSRPVRRSTPSDRRRSVAAYKRRPVRRRRRTDGCRGEEKMAGAGRTDDWRGEARARGARTGGRRVEQTAWGGGADQRRWWLGTGVR